MNARRTAGATAAVLLLVAACGNRQLATRVGGSAEPRPGQAPAARTKDDGSRCEWEGQPNKEASESAGAGFLQPNVRRVYEVTGADGDRRTTLICRELDTNFDQKKDVFRWYNAKGESVREEADSDFDGRVDTWLTFTKGRVSEEILDSNHDGEPDEWKVYSDGKISRARRATQGHGAPDVWEMYQNGKLERSGVDLDHDGRVDRWDHDTEAKRKAEAAARKQDEEKAEAAHRAVDAQAAEADASDGAPTTSSPAAPGTSAPPASAPRP